MQSNDKTRRRSSAGRQWEGHRLNEPSQGIFMVFSLLTGRGAVVVNKSDLEEEML